MLRRAHVDEIFEEHDVFNLDPDAEAQHLAAVVFAIGLQRGEVLERDPRIEDGIFASLAICIPSWKQKHRYTEFMQGRRREWFTNMSEDDAFRRGSFFFAPGLYRFELYELGELVNSRDPVASVEPYLGSSPLGL
jgi:hypothetical protein